MYSSHFSLAVFHTLNPLVLQFSPAKSCVVPLPWFLTDAWCFYQSTHFRFCLTIWVIFPRGHWATELENCDSLWWAWFKKKYFLYKMLSTQTKWTRETWMHAFLHSHWTLPVGMLVGLHCLQTDESEQHNHIWIIYQRIQFERGSKSRIWKRLELGT